MTTMAIVTPWLDHPELVEDYFAAVTPELEAEDELIIVDNGSRPPLDFATLSPGTNLGFAGGSNFGLHQAATDAVLFLNDDIELVREGWLDEIRNALEPGVLVGQMRNAAHTVVNGQHFPYLDGWCLAGMREDLLQLGGFDADLEEPAYYSDNLLCLRAREAGMTLRDVRVGLRHKLNATAGSALHPRVRQATIANHARYAAKARELLVAA